MKVVYNTETNKIFLMPEYLIDECDGIVHTSTPWAIWRERLELVILGDF